MRNTLVTKLRAMVGRFVTQKDAGAVRSAANANSDGTKRLRIFSSALRSRYNHTDKVTDLDRAVYTAEQAVAATPEGDPDRAMFLSNLSNALYDRYEHTSELADLDVGEQALAVTPVSDPNHAERLNDLSDALLIRYECIGEFADLDRAIALAERAVADTPEGHPNLAARLSSLGNALRSRGERTGEQADLNRAVDAGELALATAPEGDPRRVSCLSNLAAALSTRYERTGELADLDGAVALADQAVAGTPEGDPYRTRHLSNLCTALDTRYRRTGTLADLDRAIDVGEQGLAATSEDDPGRAACLSNLAVTLSTRYERTGKLADLSSAVALSEQAVTVTPADHPAYSIYLSDLGLALKGRYERTGELADLDRAIDIGEQTVAVAPEGDPDRARCLSNLSDALRIRYERTGELADLDRAVDISEQAVAGTPANHPNHAGRLSNLGNALRIRYERTGELADLDRAIDVGEQTLIATPEGHPYRAVYLSNLGSALDARYERTGELSDLDRAIDISAQAVIATPVGHPNRAIYQQNHSASLRNRYMRTGGLADLNRAIDVGEQALAATPADHPSRTSVQMTLGLALHTRYDSTGDPADLAMAIDSFRGSAELMSAPALLRAQAARLWGLAAMEARDWSQAVEGLTNAVRLLGEVAPRGLRPADQEHQLRPLMGVGQDAAAACLQANLPEKAVELFEQGRGVLFAQILDSRTDLTDLAREHPALAREFAGLTSRLEGPDSPRAGEPPILANSEDPHTQARATVERRRQAAAQLQHILRVIRGQEGFETFMLPRPVHELLPSTEDGPVVLINVAKARSDALILRSTGVQVLPLAGLEPINVVNHVNSFLRALHDAQDPAADSALRVTAEARLTEVLGWLWDSLTGPVLDHLGFISAPSDDQSWPHVHWCPSGPLSFLPLHAAGHHETRFEEQPSTVIDRVISSTIPTVRGLIYARQRHTLSTQSAFSSDECRVLVVAMPHTPDQADLPGSVDEATIITKMLAGRVDVLGLPGTPHASHEAVIAALPTHAWAHFSCHGASDLEDPSASHLLLSDFQSHPLTVLDLSRARLDKVELAFLSACATARPDVTLPDEPVHLAAACQLAGYPHVIATLWPIDDQDAVEVTRTVYNSLVSVKDNIRRAGTAASALHFATRNLRALYPHDPSHWAAHIHTGPYNPGL